MTIVGRGSDCAGPLRVTTVPIDNADELLRLLPAEDAVAWVREDDGLVGWGEAARYEVSGYERFSRANRWWTRLCAEAIVTDEVQCVGSGPVAFASFAFDQGPRYSVLVVPRLVVGRRDGKTWLTTMSTEPMPTEPMSSKPVVTGPAGADEAIAEFTELGESGQPISPGAIDWDLDPARVERWQESVEGAVNRIRAGQLDKVVLARDVYAHCQHAIDSRHLLTRLAERYPECWTFCVDGLVGATPELLVRRSGDRVTSRVLAGTVRTASDGGEDRRLARELLGSHKDQEEHEYAVRSVAASLSAHCTDLEVPDEPDVLRLANVQHLATDVTGLLVDDTNVLALAASLHPTAAVCGTPTERAFAVISAIEGIDRGRYAGPVGWIDAHGDGEFGIALRCGEISRDNPHTIRLFAGCGIVAESNPAAEVAESEAKLLAMRHALTSD